MSPPRPDPDAAAALAAWLDAPGPPPDALEADVREAIWALRPERAPAPRIDLDELIEGLVEGPLATPATDEERAEAEGFAAWLDGRGAAPPRGPAAEAVFALRPERAPPVAPLELRPAGGAEVVPLRPRGRPWALSAVGGLAAAAVVLFAVRPGDLRAPPEPQVVAAPALVPEVAAARDEADRAAPDGGAAAAVAPGAITGAEGAEGVESTETRHPAPEPTDGARGTAPRAAPPSAEPPPPDGGPALAEDLGAIGAPAKALSDADGGAGAGGLAGRAAAGSVSTGASSAGGGAGPAPPPPPAAAPAPPRPSPSGAAQGAARPADEEAHDDLAAGGYRSTREAEASSAERLDSLQASAGAKKAEARRQEAREEEPAEAPAAAPPAAGEVARPPARTRPGSRPAADAAAPATTRPPAEAGEAAPPPADRRGLEAAHPELGPAWAAARAARIAGDRAAEQRALEPLLAHPNPDVAADAAARLAEGALAAGDPIAARRWIDRGRARGPSPAFAAPLDALAARAAAGG